MAPTMLRAKQPPRRCFASLEQAKLPCACILWSLVYLLDQSNILSWASSSAVDDTPQRRSVLVHRADSARFRRRSYWSRAAWEMGEVRSDPVTRLNGSSRNIGVSPNVEPDPRPRMFYRRDLTIWAGGEVLIGAAPTFSASLLSAMTSASTRGIPSLRRFSLFRSSISPGM